jgi:hypothetical protein
LKRAARAAAAFILVAALLLADGGTVLLRSESGGLVVTVFGTPQVGTADLSVLVQRAEDRSAILDAEVEIRAGGFARRATHTEATNKLLYAARVRLARPGREHLEVKVTSRGEAVTVEGDLDVAPRAGRLVSYWPYFAIVPIAVFLFVLNQRLKSKRSKRRREARP